MYSGKVLRSLSCAHIKRTGEKKYSLLSDTETLGCQTQIGCK
jgi:hypothetical protein